MKKNEGEFDTDTIIRGIVNSNISKQTGAPCRISVHSKIKNYVWIIWAQQPCSHKVILSGTEKRGEKGFFFFFLKKER